jgi:phosphoribosylformylglycinamidine cyclo-ligase
MSKSFSESYKAAGVDITAGYKAVELMKSHIARTMTKNVVSDIGGFGGLFELDMTGITKDQTVNMNIMLPEGVYLYNTDVQAVKVVLKK